MICQKCHAAEARRKKGQDGWVELASSGIEGAAVEARRKKGLDGRGRDSVRIGFRRPRGDARRIAGPSGAWIVTGHLKYQAAARNHLRELAAMALVLIAGLGEPFFQHPAVAQPLWQWTPYRVTVHVSCDDCPAWSEGDVRRLLTDLQWRLEYRFGTRWEPRVAALPEDAARLLLPDLPDLPGEALPKPWRDLKTADKIVAVRISSGDNGVHIMARQWDVRVERWGPLVQVAVSTESPISEAVMRAVTKSHVPLALIQVSDDGGVRLHQRGVALSTPSAPQGGTAMEEWTPVYHVLARYEDRDGNARAVLTLPWTVLLPRESDTSGLACEVISGVRNPLTARRRGRVELLAWGQRPPGGTTGLQLISRDERKRPLPYYDVFAKTTAGDDFRWIGRTDLAGRLEVEGRGELPLVLAIKHGDRLIARLPLVPGMLAQATVAIPDDDPRLEAEAVVRGVQDELIDLVIQRTVLLAKVRARVAEEKWDEAADLLDQIRKLKSREVFSSEIMQLQQRIYCPEATAQQQVDRMFNEARRLVHQYLDPSEFEKLVQQVSHRRRNPSSG